jgi:predicted dehydrogenase
MTEQSGTLRAGVVGTGWITRAHAHALQVLNHIEPLSRRVQLAALAGRTPERIEPMAKEFGFERWTTRWEDVVGASDVDVIACLGANALHAPVSIAALGSGKPVLCEKPLAESAEEAEQIVDVAEATGLSAACGFNYRFVPAVRLMRDLLSSGRLGDVCHFRGLYLQDWASSEATTRPNLTGAGSVLDYSHILDMLLYLVGEPTSVDGLTTSFAGGSDDAFLASCELPQGATASLEASRYATGRKGVQRVEVNGTLGSVWWDMEDVNRLHVFFVDDERTGLGGFRDILVSEPDHPFMHQWWPPGHVIGWEHSFVHQWRAFLEAVIEQRPVDPLQANFADGLRIARFADAIYESARESRRIPVELSSRSSKRRTP